MSTPLQQLSPVTLCGQHIRLEPLGLSHLDDLCAVGLEPVLWTWIPEAVRNREEMQRYIETALTYQQMGHQLPFAIVDSKTNKAIGSTRYCAIDIANRRLEIGWTWIGLPWQRTVVNTECKYLLIRHAFEEIGCIRVELKTDALNEKSRRAIRRIGAKEEGTLRKHMITESGRMRDTVYHSIVDNEWKDVKAALEAKLQR